MAIVAAFVWLNSQEDSEGLITTGEWQRSVVGHYLACLFAAAAAKPVSGPRGGSLLVPIVCPILAGLSPGVPGVVDIDAEGDVDVLGVPIHDCPPYHDGDRVPSARVRYWEARLTVST